jgi:hypothetical protein
MVTSQSTDKGKDGQPSPAAPTKTGNVDTKTGNTVTFQSTERN